MDAKEKTHQAEVTLDRKGLGSREPVIEEKPDNGGPLQDINTGKKQ